MSEENKYNRGGKVRGGNYRVSSIRAGRMLFIETYQNDI